ncbi:MAG: cysteine desulfurase family protein [Oscillospiraceae bacterium]
MIYLDNAATAPVNKSALEAALPFMTELFGNPSSAHTAGRRAAMAVMRAREQCAAAIGAESDEIIFTSGGTEADNLAIHSAAALGRKLGKKHIITTAIEHPAVLNACKSLEDFTLTVIPPDRYGFVTAAQIESALTEQTVLVSVMTANNEIGTIQPIAQIGALCRSRGVIFHTDAVQALGAMPIDINELCVDMLCASAHKLGGLQGSGMLFCRRGTEISPLIFGGGQERGLRSGTENTAGIAAFGCAVENAVRNIPEKQRKISEMRDMLIHELKKIPDSQINGGNPRLCGNVNMSFAGVQGESLVLSLDIAGVCASSGSACASGSGEPSHVLKAIGVSGQMLDGSLRLTLSENNTPDEVHKAAAIITDTVLRLRRLCE